MRLHRPRAPRGDRAALLWIHGGGYVIGSAAQDDGLCRRLADRVGVTVAAVDYRLAPEHPYPAALDDCRSAYAWLAGRADVDHERVVVAGASAGGGLAAALTLRLRDEGWPPVFQHLVYPMLDHRALDRRTGSTDGHRMWNADVNRLGWDSYLDSADPSAAVPACVDDLSGLPRTWIGVGTLDPLLEEDREYARRLTASGVPCELHVVDGAFHGFDAVAPRAGVSREFLAEQSAVLTAALDDTRPTTSAKGTTDERP